MSQISNKIAIIGSGKMGDTIISGLLASGIAKADQITASDPSAKRLDYIKTKHGVHVTTDNHSAVKAAQILIFCVKPQNAEGVFASVKESIESDDLVISIMAGVTLRKMEGWLPLGTSVIRVMPNTPSQVNAGMSAIARGSSVSDDQLSVTQRLFSSVGRTIVLDEKHFDAVTGLSASGPAFIYIVIEALADGGVKSGLPRETAIELAAQMTLGAAKMVLETGKHPAILKDDVTTPAGCTTDGILALEEGGVRVTLIKAVTEATRRAGELG
ncbi:MAG: pyrroline-5-carboxylate reductase [Balneolales bacterium]|nr:pyrroline-5-carboxylate reductase [Balneolales bacterium]